MEEIGPVDYAVVSFPGNDFNGEIIGSLTDLDQAGTIRLIDVAFVSKDANGDVVAFEIMELAPEVQEAFAALDINVQGLFSDEDLLSAGHDLEPSSSAAVVVWENVWASKVAQAVRDSGGSLVAIERVPHDVVQAAREWAHEAANA